MAVRHATATMAEMQVSTGTRSAIRLGLGRVSGRKTRAALLAHHTPPHTLAYGPNGPRGTIEVLNPALDRLLPGRHHNAGAHYGDGQAAALLLDDTLS